MIQIINKKDCCGCTACSCICPKDCISMETDNEGFIYPSIDSNNCIDCHLCEKVCPMLNEIHENKYQLHSFIARDKRSEVLSNGTSGSVFTSIMESILTNDGVVYGVVVGDNNVIKHVRIDSVTDINFPKIPGSKYVKSNIEGIYKQVKNDVITGKRVIFSGTPCQVAGLKSFLQKEYANLYTVDVVCHGNPSPLLWKRYCEYQENKNKSKISFVRFRNKTYGYHSGTMKLTFENGKEYYGSARVDLFLRSFFSDLCSRPSCYDCKFKQAEHQSDLTLFDSWHASQLNSAIHDDDKGFTNVIVQTQKGQELLKAILENIELYESDLDKAIELDGIMVNNSVDWNKAREVFFEGLTEEPLDKHCAKFFKVTLKDKLIEKAKKFYYRKKFQGNKK